MSSDHGWARLVVSMSGGEAVPYKPGSNGPYHKPSSDEALGTSRGVLSDHATVHLGLIWPSPTLQVPTDIYETID